MSLVTFLKKKIITDFIVASPVNIVNKRSKDVYIVLKYPLRVNTLNLQSRAVLKSNIRTTSFQYYNITITLSSSGRCTANKREAKIELYRVSDLKFRQVS